MKKIPVYLSKEEIERILEAFKTEDFCGKANEEFAKKIIERLKAELETFEET